ncbi:hypothetical protein MB02_02280 [Croceicoccus estronivorus]|uniref:PaaI family thioesterase n=1 Tax=Croceicoccus estronivorus TaxID=1172626 RepID=UPI00082ED4C7|nr:PaaI family thioesterase [Croceicoccus estronivorus]OCC25486.1 hypothetical protein MB02_02280 [Croceicoccus estronivorus]
MNDGAFTLTSAQQQFLDTALTSGYSAWCGVTVEELGPGHARLAFRPREEMLTPWQTLNGSVMNSIVEIPSFVALVTELAEHELPVTSDIFIQHVRPMPGDADYALEGRVLRKGKSMAWTEVTASVGGKAVTYARITKSIVGRK